MRKLVLWGHQPADYEEMFDISSEDLHKNILEFGCGPSAINSNLPNVISVDPLFTLDKDTLSSKISLLFAQMLEEVQQNQGRYDFSSYGGLERLVWERKKGIESFFNDYKLGLEEGRYLPAVDCSLPFKDFQFEYALSSHYLFAGLDNQTVEFLVQLIKELARVAKEVRIFPLIDRYGDISEFLGPVLLELQNDNYGAELKEVKYRLQPSGNAMLRVWAQQCVVE